MDKIDLKKTLKPLYAPSSKTIEFVEVPEMTYIMLDGSGDPNNNPVFDDAVGTLNAVAYAIKFAMKAHELDFVVMPTEGLWWVENLAALDFDDKSNWLWTLMIAQPDAVTQEVFDQVITDVRKKKNPPQLENVRLTKYAEGLSAQTLYIGSYADELPTIAKLHDEITSRGYALHRKHHEIYLSDPRKSAPEKLKTVIRQPVKVK